MGDLQLQQNVVDELDFEPRVDSAHIGVAVTGGVVTLSGHVASYVEKLAAEAATRRVKGVRAIADEIEVRYPFEKKTADDEIAKRALDILNWDATVPPGAVIVTVRDGLVTLSGEVEWKYQKSAAEGQIRKLSGVNAIINNIKIKPRVQPSDIQQRIENALRRNAEVEAHAVRVVVQDGGKVTLEGTVHDWQEREAIQNAAWSAPGVVSVKDHLNFV
jgi:osmotically-inducible protein OsmY